MRATSTPVFFPTGLCSGSLVSMSANKSALEALAMMHKYDVSAVAVVDGAGRLMGSFSMSAMRSIVAEHFGALALPVAEFLALALGEPGASGAIHLQLPACVFVPPFHTPHVHSG